MKTKELLILRHGKSDWDVACDDFLRPLTERGKRGAELLGEWLRQQELYPDFVLSSPATRALDTATRCCKAIGLNDRLIFQEQRIYESNLTTLKNVLHECPPQAQRVLLVGHNPGLESLLKDLVNHPLAEPEDGKLLPTATLAHLTLTESWIETTTKCGYLNSLLRATTLEKQFPFINLKEKEYRPRPAYYYAQSGVLPYRMMDGQCQLLLISSDNQRRWSLPKGVIEPGLSPQASAAKEAWEEAGIKGIVSDQSLGNYQREKWHGVCSIQVFPMLVTQMILTSEWEENHRKRQWFAPKQAIKMLDQADLTVLIELFLGILENSKS